MGNLHLVTGYLGQEHIKATDQAAFNAALIGTGQFVLDKGKVFEAQIINNNQIRILDGELMMQGRFVRLDPDTYVDLAIDNGTQGKKRNDIVVARYTKNSVTGAEEVSVVVIKGTAVDSNPVDPAHTEADITNGTATLHDYPLWRIPIDGLNVGNPIALFGEPFIDSMRTLPEIRRQVENIHKEVDDQLAEQDKDIDEKIAGIVSYTKAETLTDATKGLFGLPSSAVPDNAFSKLADLYKHVWRVQAIVPACAVLDTPNKYAVFHYYQGWHTTFSYSDTYSVNADGKVVLSGTIETQTVNASQTPLTESHTEKMVGKYVTWSGTSGNSDGVYYMVNKQVTYSDVTYYCNMQKLLGIPESPSTEESYVQSTNRNAYPDFGKSGDYHYTYLGLPFDLVCSSGRITNGFYIGTGLSGSSAPNTITFEFVPKMIIVADGVGIMIGIRGNSKAMTTKRRDYASSFYINQIEWAENTVTWYSGNGADVQFNNIGMNYYVAIG